MFIIGEEGYRWEWRHWIKVYTDESRVDRQIGATAVLYCDGMLKRKRRMRVGEAPPVRAESHNHQIPGPVRARDSATTQDMLIANPHGHKQGFHHFWIIRGSTHHHLNPCLSQQ